MKRFSTFLTLVAVLCFTSVTQAGPGPAPLGTAIGQYNIETGEIIVSVNSVVNWYVEGTGSIMTGTEPVGLPGAAGFVTNNDIRIGESSFSPFSYTDLNLGSVAQQYIADITSMKIYWNVALGDPLEMHPVQFVSSLNAPPSASVNGPFEVDIYTDPLNILLDASESFDDEDQNDLMYQWDLDNDGTFEVDTGLISSLTISDVTATFGGIGVYPVAVQVTDGVFIDKAFTSVTLINSIPEPPTSLLCFALIGLYAARRPTQLRSSR